MIFFFYNDKKKQKNILIISGETHSIHLNGLSLVIYTSETLNREGRNRNFISI